MQSAASRRRGPLLWAIVASVLIEIAWTLHLAPSLPGHYRAQHWSTVWVGLDVSEIVMLVFTVWALWRQRVVAVVLASATGALFLFDAWFDITTDQHRDITQGVLLAIFWEVPWAVLLFWIARRELIRTTATGDVSRS